MIAIIWEGKEFKYQGTIWTEDNYIATEIKQWIIWANKTSYGMKKKLNSLNLKHETKRMLYKTLIRPILTYGSKCQPLLKNGNMLWIFERILRMVYGSINDNGKWRTIYNYEFYILYHEPDTVKWQKQEDWGGWDTSLEHKYWILAESLLFLNQKVLNK